MSTYQSIQSNSTDTTSLVITKPTSLAVGDLMLAGIWIAEDSGGAHSLNTPSGWTLIKNKTNSTTEELAVYAKVADASDVSASNFTFTGNSTGSRNMIGHILRITNYGLVDDSTSGSNTASTTITATGFTPDYANDLFVMFVGASSSATIPTIDNYTITTNNPTWTERADVSFNDTTRDSALGVATATRAEVTATGTATGGINNGTGARAIMIMVALAPKVSGSTTVVSGNTYVVNHPFLRNGVTQIDGTDPTTNSRDVTEWTNETKPTATTWTNQDK